MPLGKPPVEIVTGGGETRSGNCALTEAPTESLKVTVTTNVPLCAGVPMITPVCELKVNDGGSPLADQVYGGVPPLPCSVAVYSAPAVPVPSEVVAIASEAVTVNVAGAEALPPGFVTTTG